MDESSISYVLQALGVNKLKSSGGRVKASCPFASYTHPKGSDRNPSFGMTINPNGNSAFHCFTCKASGKKAISLLYRLKELTGSWRSDLAAYIQDREGGSLSERFRKLSSFEERRTRNLNAPTTAPWTIPGYEAEFKEEDFKHFLDFVPKYALERGITIEQAKKWKIGYDQDYERLFLSIYDETGKLVGWSKRAISEDQTPKYMHAEYMRRDKYMYGEQFIDKDVRVGYMSEGFMDVLALDRFGLKNVVAALGTACSPLHIEKLKKWFDKVVIFPHNDPEPPREGEDPPGLKMAKDYREALRAVGVKAMVAPMIKGKKDPGEWTLEEFQLIYSRISLCLESS